MSSSSSPKTGKREPRIRVASGVVAYSDGDDACDLMEAMGFTPDGWQRDVMVDWCARDTEDSPSYLTMGLTVPRQNGKNGDIEIFEYYKMIVCGEHILHTAHQVKTANKSFQRLASFFSDPAHPEIKALVANIRRTNGEQGIYLKNGAFIEYSARSRGASRGNTYSIVVFDEAQELKDDQIEALMPTLAASLTGYRQLIYTGTPPGPDSPGTVFERLRSSCLSETCPKKTCWHEWSIEELPDPNSTFADLLPQVYDTNPAMGIRLDEDFTENEFTAMSIDGFARERLGWWAEKATVTAKISEKAWKALEVAPEDAPVADKTCFGVKFSADGSEVALVACDLCGDSFVLGLVATATLADGTRWIADYLSSHGRPESVAAIAIDGLRGRAALVSNLNGVYPRQAIMQTSSRDVISAATMLDEAIRDKVALHLSGAGQEPLNISALTSLERPIGRDGGWGFGGDHAACIEAASLALWACKTTRRDPGGGGVVL